MSTQPGSSRRIVLTKAIASMSRRPRSGLAITVPQGTEQARTFLQDRLSLFGRAIFVISGAFWSLANVAAIFGPAHGDLTLFVAPGNLFHLAQLGVLLGVWVSCSRGRMRQ